MTALRISEDKQITISTETSSLIQTSHAPSTVKSYRNAIKKLGAWLDGRVLTDSVFANYIAELHQEGKSPATINIVVSAVKCQAKAQDAAISFELTERTLAGIRRAGKDRGRGQVDGITWEEVNQICTLAEAEGTTTGLRDSALIRLMSDCLLRISEAVAIDVTDVDSVLTIRQSKTDQESEGTTLYIGDPTREVIKRYCEAGDITDGPLFRRIRRGDNITSGRLSVVGARNAIKRRAREAGVEGFISGQSLRIGSAVSLAQAGASVVDMQVAGRWKSPEMPAHYAKKELTDQNAVARFKYGK